MLLINRAGVDACSSGVYRVQNDINCLCSRLSGVSFALIVTVSLQNLVQLQIGCRRKSKQEIETSKTPNIDYISIG